MKLNDFMKEVHENAVAHGWWETDRSFAECIVLIHSEWSEALEEARAGRPMVWHGCTAHKSAFPMCELGSDCAEKYRLNEQDCPYYDRKPEGIAVELMDGVIRILDLCGRYSYRFKYGTVRQLEAGISRENPVQSAKQRPSPFFCGLGTIEVILLLGVQTADMLRQTLRKQEERHGQPEGYGTGGPINE